MQQPSTGTRLSLTVNGQARQFDGVATLADLIAALNLDKTRVASELNFKLVRKADYAATTLKDGDKVEIVTFVGGG